MASSTLKKKTKTKQKPTLGNLIIVVISFNFMSLYDVVILVQ